MNRVDYAQIERDILQAIKKVQICGSENSILYVSREVRFVIESFMNMCSFVKKKKSITGLIA